MIPPKIPLTTESIIEKKSADQKSETANPGTIDAASIIRSAFMTRINRPNVISVTGSVSSINNGLKNVLINPRTIASTKTAVSPDTTTPGSKYAVIAIANAYTNH